MNALLLALVALTSDAPVTLHLEWEGGDPSTPPATVVEVHEAPNKTGSGGTPSEATAPEPVSLSICPCRGSNRGVCHCLARGVTCRCSSNVGSEWIMADGRPVKKTGKYLDPNSPLKTPPLSISVGQLSHAPPKSDGYEATLRNDGRYWWTVDSTHAYWVGKQPANGDSFTIDGQVWECVDGRMRLKGSQMAADLAPKGKWVRMKVCHGNYCTYEMRFVPQ